MIYSDALKKLVSTLASEGWSASAISHHLDLELGFVVRHFPKEFTAPPTTKDFEDWLSSHIALREAARADSRAIRSKLKERLLSELENPDGSDRSANAISSAWARHLEVELRLDDSLLVGLKEAALRLDLG